MFKWILVPLAWSQVLLPVKNVDDLYNHYFQCGIKMDSDLVVSYCQDGYIALDSVYNFLMSAGSHTQARK